MQDFWDTPTWFTRQDWKTTLPLNWGFKGVILDQKQEKTEFLSNPLVSIKGMCSTPLNSSHTSLNSCHTSLNSMDIFIWFDMSRMVIVNIDKIC